MEVRKVCGRWRGGEGACQSQKQSFARCKHNVFEDVDEVNERSWVDLNTKICMYSIMKFCFSHLNTEHVYCLSRRKEEN